MRGCATGSSLTLKGTNMPKIARTDAERGGSVGTDADAPAELGRRAADSVSDVARETTGRAQDATRRGLDVVQRTAEAVGEVRNATVRRSMAAGNDLGSAFIHLMQEQVRHNLQTLTALGRAVDWQQIARIQTRFVRESLVRGTELTQRYGGIMRAVANSAGSAAKNRTGRAG